MDGGPPGSSAHGILQTRIQEWVAMPPPGNLPDPGVEPTSLLSPALAGRVFTTGTTWEAPWGWFRATEIQLGTPGLSAGCLPPLHVGPGFARGGSAHSRAQASRTQFPPWQHLLPPCSQSRPSSRPLFHPAEKTGSSAPLTPPPRSERAGRFSEKIFAPCLTLLKLSWIPYKSW